jgi:hypothetical protein
MFYLLKKTHRTFSPAVTLLTVGLFLLRVRVTEDFDFYQRAFAKTM